MRSYRQMKDVGKAHYYEAKAEACERRSAEHAVPVRPAGIGAILWLFPVLSHSAGLSGLSPRRAAELYRCAAARSFYTCAEQRTVAVFLLGSLEDLQCKGACI
jgi:hypothetical protein